MLDKEQMFDVLKACVEDTGFPYTTRYHGKETLEAFGCEGNLELRVKLLNACSFLGNAKKRDVGAAMIMLDLATTQAAESFKDRLKAADKLGSWTNGLYDIVGAFAVANGIKETVNS